MDRWLPALTPPPPLSWPLRLVLVLLMPAWLPILGIVLAFGIHFAESGESAHDLAPETEDDGRPDDWVPPLVPPARRSTSGKPFTLRPVQPKAPAHAEPGPACVTHAALPTARPAQRTPAQASCWSTSFPAG